MDETIAYQVWPGGQAPTENDSRLELSDIDQLLPPVLVPYCLVFPYTAEEPDQKQELVDRLRAGLERCLKRYPISGGTVMRDEVTGRAYVRCGTKKDATILKVRGLQKSEQEVLSYSELDRSGYDPIAFPAERLVPLGHFQGRPGDAQPEGQPASMFQITFISGGVIITAQFNHLITDGPSNNMFLTEWSKCSRLSSEPQPLSAQPSPPRSILTTKKSLDSAQVKSLESVLNEGGYMTLLDLGQREAAVVSPITKLWRMSRKSVADLKVTTQESVGSEWRISTNDCINAALWQGFARSRLRDSKPDDQATSSLYPAAGFRGRREVEFPNDYYGNALSLCRAKMPLKDLVEPGNLPIVAREIRKGVLSMSQTAIKNLVDFSGNINGYGKRFRGIKSGTMDLTVTSWAHIACYTDYDFGFGLPTALRVPDPKTECCVLFPPRPAEGRDDAVEAFLCVDEPCQEWLFKDEHFREYFDAV